MSIQAMSWAFDLNDPRVAGNVKFVLVSLANHADAHGRDAFPSLETLAQHTGLSKNTVRRALHDLLDLGLIRTGDPKIRNAVIDRADRRPGVYDLALAWTGSQPDTPSTPTGSQAGSQPESHGVPNEAPTGSPSLGPEPKDEPTDKPKNICDASLAAPTGELDLELPTPEPPAPGDLTGRLVVAAYCEAWKAATGRQPLKWDLAKIGAQAKRLAAAGADLEDLRTAARQMARTRFTDLATALRAGQVQATETRSVDKPSTTDARFAAGLRLTQKFRDGYNPTFQELMRRDDERRGVGDSDPDFGIRPADDW